MEQKLYDLKMKILRDRSIDDDLKKELADDIFQIEKEQAINYNRCCKSDSELFNCAKRQLYKEAQCKEQCDTCDTDTNSN